MPNNSPKSRGEDKDIWTVKQLQNSYRDPHLIIIDVRSCGKFRGGPPDNSKEIASQYHQGHLFLALNLNLEGCGTTKAITEEIYSGVRSAGGSFIDTLIFAITSGFHFLLYDQDGSNIELIDLLYEVELTRGEDTYKFPPSHLHWLEGGFNAISKNSTLKKCCYDTKSLLGREEEIDEPAYSEILPNLFVGGAVCSEEQLRELREKGVQHIINVSNVERDQEGFNCIFINTDDDQTECLNRLFHDLANLIETFIESGEGVFVHCQRGLSRSPSIIMAYLMIKKHFTHYEAFEIVKEKRPSIGPRSNFMIQLCRLR